MANPIIPRRLRFGDFEADLVAGELRKDGLSEKILLQDQPLAILRALVARPGQMVSREELFQLLWNGNTNVDFDPSLNKAINRLGYHWGIPPRHPVTLRRFRAGGIDSSAPSSQKFQQDFLREPPQLLKKAKTSVDWDR